MDVVGICNLAISWLAGNKITSLADDSVEAELCNANYENARDAVLEDGAWTFATKYYQLAPLAELPIIGDGQLFMIPPAVLRVVEADDGSDNWVLRWAKEENNIRAKTDVLYIKTIFRNVDTTKFTTGAVNAIAARIAMDICIPLTNSRELLEDMTTFYTEKMMIGKARDGQQGQRKVFTNKQLIVVR